MHGFRSAWSGATEIVDTIYDRKAALYTVLYEIYDQLSLYGTGDIGILAGGDAGGFGGSAGIGIGFRTGQAASSIAAQAVSLPAGAVPTGPTMGPQRPAAAGAASNSEDAFSNFVLDRQYGGSGQSGGGAPIFFGGNTLSGGTGGFSPGTGPASSGGPAPGVGFGAEGPDLSGPAATRVSENAVQWKWVPVRSYFGAKREELLPFIQNPSFSLYDGSVRSDNAYAAELSVQFAAEHPIGVVEYSWRLSAEAEEEADLNAEGEGETGVWEPFVVQTGEVEAVGGFLAEVGEEDEAENAGGGLFGLFSPAPLETGISLQLYVPWFSLGGATSFEDTLFPGNFEEGRYALTIRARAAGGTSIIRKGRIELQYFDPGEDSAPLVADLDSSDSTPPTPPVIELASPFSNRPDSLYAAWSSSDPDTGISRYRYAVIPYEESVDTGGGSSSGLPGGGSSFASPGSFQAGGAFTGGSGIGLSSAQRSELIASIAEDDSIPWRDAESLREMNIRGLSLDHGEHYVVAVKAINGAGLSSIGFSSPVLADLTAPEETEIQGFELLSVEGHPNSLRLRCGSAVDPESGIASLQFAVGTEEGRDDIWEWTEIGGSDTDEYSALLSNLPLAEGQEIFLSLRALNHAGSLTENADSITVSFGDGSPPEAVEVVLQPDDYVGDASLLSGAWSFSEDEESGILGYEYGIGSSPESPDIQWWSPVERVEESSLIDDYDGKETVPVDGFEGAEKSGRRILADRLRDSLESAAPFRVDLSGLELQHGVQHYLLVRITNGAGLSTISSGGPLLADTTAPEISSFMPAQGGLVRGPKGYRFVAADPESGIAAYKYTVVSSADIAAGPSRIIFESDWIPVAATGTMPEIERTIAGEFSLDNLPEGSDAPLIRVRVMNGAGSLSEAATSYDEAEGKR